MRFWSKSAADMYTWFVLLLITGQFPRLLSIFLLNLFRLSLILRVAGLNLFLVNCYFMEVRRLSFGGSFHDQVKIRLGKARLVVLKKETEGYM